MFGFLDRRKIDEVLPVDPEELAWRNQLRNFVERLRQRIFGLVESHDRRRIVLDKKIGDLCCLDRDVFVVLEHKETAFAGFFTVPRQQQVEIGQVLFIALEEVPEPGSLEDCVCDILARKRFEDVIDAVGFERLNRVIVERGAKNNRRDNVNAFKNFEAKPVGELDVHKNEVGLVIFGEVFYGAVDTLDVGQYLRVGPDAQDKLP